MNLRILGWIGIAIFVLWKAWGQWALRPIERGDGELAPDDPVQTPLEDQPDIVMNRWTLTPRATYDITARVLAREDYRFDPIASLVPMDLALGWGAMSDNQVLSAFEISQGARFYSWRPVAEPLPIATQEVILHSANTHVIPASEAIALQLDRVRRGGEVVHLTGMLVDGKRDDGMTLRTSLTRVDSGAGACEVLLVQDIEIL